MGYISNDSIDTYSLHDATILDIWIRGTSMFWKVDGAVVQGISCKENIANSTNNGEDRYADPYIEIEFQNFEVSSFLCVGSKCYQNNVLIVEYPPKFLFSDQYKKTLDCIVNDSSNVIYAAKEISRNPTIISIDFGGGKEHGVYTLQLLSTGINVQWQEFGKEAWYLEQYRKRNT